MILKLDENGDIAIENNSFVLIGLTASTSLDEIEQNLKQRLRVFLGEWFLDQREGLPYFEHILVKAPDPVVLDTVFKRVIIGTAGVLELLSFDLNLDTTNRKLTVSFKVEIKTQ